MGLLGGEWCIGTWACLGGSLYIYLGFVDYGSSYSSLSRINISYDRNDVANVSHHLNGTE